MTDGPLKQAFDLLDTDGVLSRELITYRIRNRMVVKETASRKYFENDYNDHVKTEPLVKIEK